MRYTPEEFPELYNAIAELEKLKEKPEAVLFPELGDQRHPLQAMIWFTSIERCAFYTDSVFLVEYTVVDDLMTDPEVHLFGIAKFSFDSQGWIMPNEVHVPPVVGAPEHLFSGKLVRFCLIA